MTKAKDKMMLALIGKPNCGKSALFNALTGARQKVAIITFVIVGIAGWSVISRYVKKVKKKPSGCSDKSSCDKCSMCNSYNFQIKM